MTAMVQTSLPQFHIAPRAAIRAAKWWSPLAYIQRRLPAAVARYIERLELTDTHDVLDYGCADRPYRHLLPTGYVGADLPGNSAATLHLLPDGRVPAQDNQFDAILSTQVLEHVENPGLYLAECHRLLRPGGRLLLSTHGFMVYHPDPVDYWRWTGPGLRRQVEAAGLRVRESAGVMGLAACGLQLFQDGIWGHLPGFLQPVWGLTMQSLIWLFDRRNWPPRPLDNALVFILIAEKAEPSSPRAAA